MKTILSAGLLCLFSLTIVSCVNEQFSLGVKIIKDAELTFDASQEVSDSKTVLSGTDILWQNGDQIKVYQGSHYSGNFTATATEPCTKTSFIGSMTIALGEPESTSGSRGFWAVYPASAALGCDDSSVTLQVSVLQTAQEGTFAQGVFPSVAKSADYSLGFYNVCGGIKFTVAQSGIRKVVLRSGNGDLLAGKAKVSFSGSTPVIQSVSEGIDSVVVNAPDNGVFVAGKEYFIVALPTALENGFSLTFVNEYGKAKFSSSASVEIKRKTFATLEEKDKVGILFRDKVAKAACVAMFDKDKDGAVSFDEAALATNLEGLFEDYETVEYFPEIKYFTSVTDLKGCFTNCEYLKEIEIPSFITGLGDKAFYGCSSLANIRIPSSVKSIGSEAFRYCSALSLVKIEEGLESIGARAFSNTAVAEITLPASIKTIGNRSFGNETEEIIMAGSVPPSLSAISFGSTTKFYVPNDAVSTYKSSEGWEEFEEYIFPLVEKPFDLSATGTANCYVVNKTGKFKFKATVKGNSTESVGTPASAELLWESFGTDVEPSVGDIIQAVGLSEGYVTLNTPETLKNGNAVIAVKDASGNILWSWHIWVCKDFDPAETAQVYKNNAGTMMDRNLGATSATPADVHALGLLYQWGRKDPFLGSSSISSSSLAASTLSWPSPVSSNSSNGTIAYTVAHPTTFITYNSSNSDWYYTGSSSTDNTRWQTTKTMYDPCPPGWRVPDGGSSGVWSKAFGSSSYYEYGPWNSTNKGMNFGSGNGKSIRMQLGSTTTIWYPAAGNRSDGNGSLYNAGGSNSYWSCTPIGNNAYSLDFDCVGRVNPSGYICRSIGYSVRCFPE